MWQIFVKGGWVMYPLAFCSVTALVVIIERTLFYIRFKGLDERELNLLKLYLNKGKSDEAKQLLATWRSPLGLIVEAGLKQRESDPELIETAMQSAGDQQMKRLQRGLHILDTVVTASPLLGLLGTVTGIIKAFTAISVGGASQASQLGAGIAEALYNTAFGLAIAIPALFLVNIFYGIAERKASEMSYKSQEILAILVKG
ncbi:biopolymer transport protein ExbB [Hydrogenispora ethanolica]|uniref:Biopolymer transport protein ExbB n=1 Tax=Hydrogenispora ethanolica TaxID=1082276 RepID=A0A4R1S270_HYDET|nr:MotA/TolQ/ExbB proton channel family protein [Hydrogenispora ethanolica]TCL73275.1 biopolymer transport protein ExbB [Hydrogenispora ethanolica]